MKNKPFLKSFKYFWNTVHVKNCLKKLNIQKLLSGGVLYKVILKKFSKVIGKDLCWSLFLNWFATLLKKKLRDSWFPMNFAKFLRTPFLQNTSGRQLLSIAIICQDHLKLNVRKMRTTILRSLSFWWPQLMQDL